jgi:hypothetical protein
MSSASMSSRMRSRLVLWLVTLALVAPAVMAAQAAPRPGVLSPDEVKAVLPESVFFHGQRAPVNLRHAGGVRFPGGKLLLAARVDTSGYSADLAEEYQAYLITEVKLKLGDATLAPGAYGCGFRRGQFVVLDVGGNQVLAVAEQTDDKLRHPQPFLLTSDGSSYRLYIGKRYVTLEAQAQVQ